jgi:hypothetical protein
LKPLRPEALPNALLVGRFWGGFQRGPSEKSLYPEKEKQYYVRARGHVQNSG